MTLREGQIYITYSTDLGVPLVHLMTMTGDMILRSDLIQSIMRPKHVEHGTTILVMKQKK